MQNSRCRHEKSAPELSCCRTSRVGAPIPGTDQELFYCSIENADCRYAFRFGYDYICKHRHSRSFSCRVEG